MDCSFYVAEGIGIEPIKPLSRSQFSKLLPYDAVWSLNATRHRQMRLRPPPPVVCRTIGRNERRAASSGRRHTIRRNPPLLHNSKSPRVGGGFCCGGGYRNRTYKTPF